MDILNYIESFTNNRDLMELFALNNYEPIGWFGLKNIKSKKIERLAINIDKSDPNRVHFKGKNIYFTLNTNSKGEIYLDHLLIGDVEKEEFDFSFRHNITENKIIVKLVDDKNVKHAYKIKNNTVNIERQSIKNKLPKYQTRNYNIKDYAKQKDKYEYKHFYIFKDEDGNTELPDSSKEYTDNCLKEFLILEKSFIGITSYIEKRILFLSEAINTVAYSDARLYEIKRKRKKGITKTTEENPKIYKFTKNKNNQ